MKAYECMENALNTFKQRASQYKNSYLQHGEVMKALFPDGIKLDSVEHFNRFGVLNMQVSKLVRYTQSWNNPHIDSSHDLGVYSFIQEELDQTHQANKKRQQEQREFYEKEYENLHSKRKDQ